MDTNDRRLIDDLAQEISRAQPATKDPEAAQLIESRIASQPDAVYLLTQAVLLQQEGLRQAQAQLQQLQAQQRQQQNRGGGLFSGLFGGGQQYAQPQYAPQQPYYSQRGSSSFLAQAASSAVGIAGGLFLFEGISNLFGGDGFGGGQDQAFEQGYDQGFGNGFDQGDQGQAEAGQGGADQSGFDQAGWDNGGFNDFDGGGDWGV